MTRGGPLPEPIELLRELVAAQGPPGAEGRVREAVARHARALGFTPAVDAKGNLLVWCGDALGPVHTVVTAHLDEIALMVSSVAPDGTIAVAPLGGVHPYKWGEAPVDILASPGPVPAILSFGCVHTEHPASAAVRARTSPLAWSDAFLFTGSSADALRQAGVRPGSRVALGIERRFVRTMGPFVCAPFLDDRADLVAWLLALAALSDDAPMPGVLFAATVAEEVGGEGAKYLLQALRPDRCVALEVGPSVPENRFLPDQRPTIWASDSFAAIGAAEADALARVCRDHGVEPHWQVLTRGGSDASCAAAAGLVAHPITLGLPMENTHGLEIMHSEAPAELARLLVAYLQHVAGTR
ncbi:MAG TPA: M20/M25/M40 family metallo-hydrolase [Chthonomonadales bacterium]|nr:M20/M25/M40 family metallo-hydrolase [Chthonomonadales bacterium]